VQEHGPRAHVEAARQRRRDGVRERVAVRRERARARRDRRGAPARRVGPERDLAALGEADAAHRVVRVQVARRVVGDGEREAVETGAVLDVVEHRLDALVHEV
jgi:hypothetical protein